MPRPPSAFDRLRLAPLDWRWRDVAVVAAIAIAATLFPYHRGLHFPFALDDYTYLLQAAGLDPAPWSLRRWLAVRGYYEAMLRLFGTRPEAWHVVAFALHAGLALGVGAWARRFGASRIAAATAAGLFAASPLAFTVLYWIACIQELGSGVFLLAAAWFLARSDRARFWAVPLFGAAVLCKESVLAAPVALALVLGRRTWRVAGLMMAVGVVLFLASGLHARMFAPDRTLPYATAYGSNLLVHLATQVAWSATFWRAYPDRLATPDTSFLLPALAVTAAVAITAIAAGGAVRRSILLACAWYLALVLPVLPLAQHAYAYYGYLPQIGFVILAAIGIERAALRLRAAPEVRIAAGAAAVAIVALCAARSTRSHETLMLPDSVVPHDSVVRSALASGAIVTAVRDAQLPASTRRVVLIGLPERLTRSTLTPGSRLGPNTERIRVIPLREALRDGDLVALHFPGRTGIWVDSLGVRAETRDTAFFVASGFNDVLRMDGPVQAYLVQAHVRLQVEDRAGAERDLRRALDFDPDHAGARTALAVFEAAAGRRDAARALIAGVDPADLPADMLPLLDQLRQDLGAAPPP